METKTFILFLGDGKTEADICAYVSVSCAQSVLNSKGVTCFAPDGKMCAKIALADGVQIKVPER